MPKATEGSSVRSHRLPPAFHPGQQRRLRVFQRFLTEARQRGDFSPPFTLAVTQVDE
jgi:hypothetical protein